VKVPEDRTRGIKDPHQSRFARQLLPGEASGKALRLPVSLWRSFTGRQYSSGGGTAAGVFQAAKYVRLKYAIGPTKTAGLTVKNLKWSGDQIRVRPHMNKGVGAKHPSKGR